MLNKLSNILHMVLVVFLANMNHVGNGKSSTDDSPLVFIQNKKGNKRSIKPRRSTIDDRIKNVSNVYLVHCKKHIGGIRGGCILL